MNEVFHSDCYKGLILGRNWVFFTWKYIEIRKSFIEYRPPPPVCQQKLLPVYVFTYFAQYMKGACWHKGETIVYGQNNSDRAGKNAVYV